MTTSYAGTLGIAAALVGTLATTAAADTNVSAPLDGQSAAPVTPIDADSPEADPLDAQPRPGEHELRTAAMTKVCDIRCQVLTFTEDTIPGLGASQVLYTILYPGKLGLSIPKSDGTRAVTFTVVPTQIARGKGLIAKGTF